jgi:hypothetical protein
MIPEPISLAPLTIAMLIGITACFYAGYKAGSGISNFAKGTLPRRVATGLLIAAATVGGIMVAFLVVANMNHDKVYNDTAWAVLAKDYNVYSAVAGEKFRPNIPFPALHAGEAAQCTVSLPDVVVCDDKRVKHVDQQVTEQP